MYQEFYDFTLPKGIMRGGVLLKKGTMRLATAGDEISAVRHPSVKENPDYISLVLLAKVITRIDGFDSEITPKLLESLTTADFTFLQNMYSTVNESDVIKMKVRCPSCGEEFMEPVNFT